MNPVDPIVLNLPIIEQANLDDVAPIVNPIDIPQNTIGQAIIVNTGDYQMPASATATLIFKQSSGANPREVTLTCTFTTGNTFVTYTTVGGELQSIPGLCDAQLRITGTGLLRYSYVAPNYVNIETPLA